MKKYLAFFLCFILLPLCVHAELNEYDFHGVWTCYIFEKDSVTNSRYHLYQIIFDDHYCTHILCDYYSSDGYVLSPYESAEHYYEINGSELIFKEYQTSKEVQFTGYWVSGYLYVSFNGKTWYKFTRSAYQYDSYTSDTIPSAFSPEVYEKMAYGLSIPAGIYTVGIDFPAGDYSLVADSSLNVVVKYNRASKNEPTSFSMTSGSVFGKLSLVDGNVFAISNGSVTLKTYSGLFD